MKGKTKKQEQKQEEGSLRGMRSAKSTLLLCLLYMAVLSTATFAWFSVNNKPKIFNLALKAGAAGNLLIADDMGSAPGEYSDELDLDKATQKVPMKEVSLNPCTTKEGKTFVAPVYTGTTVDNTEEIKAADLNKEYVYEKTFYLKAGAAEGTSAGSGAKKEYDIVLVGPKDAADTKGHSGSYVTKKAASTAKQTCANAIRISFEMDKGTAVPAVYEPNTDLHNTGEKATNGLSGYGKYETLKQSSSGNFEGGLANNSKKLFTITEGEDVKVTMRVWIEGTDEDCTNDIQLDEIEGNIQFTSQLATAAGN